MIGTQQTNTAAASAIAAAGIIDSSVETIRIHDYSPSTTEDASNEILTRPRNGCSVSSGRWRCDECACGESRIRMENDCSTRADTSWMDGQRVAAASVSIASMTELGCVSGPNATLTQLPVMLPSTAVMQG